MRVKVEALRASLAELLREARQHPITVTRYGEGIAVIVSMEDYAELSRLRSLYRIRSKGAQDRVASFQ